MNLTPSPESGTEENLDEEPVKTAAGSCGGAQRKRKSSKPTTTYRCRGNKGFWNGKDCVKPKKCKKGYVFVKKSQKCLKACPKGKKYSYTEKKCVDKNK